MRENCERHLWTCNSLGSCLTCQDAYRWLEQHTENRYAKGGSVTKQEEPEDETGDWMELATITMTDEEVEREYERYADLKTRTARKIKRGLEALEEGLQLVDIREVIKNSLDRNSFPQVAVAPYISAGLRIWCDADSRNSQITYSHTRFPLFEPVRWTMRFDRMSTRSSSTRSATVPATPEDVKQDASYGDLILWEAEWERPAPRDPALLEPIGGHLYLVKATWDMTPLEQALLT